MYLKKSIVRKLWVRSRIYYWNIFLSMDISGFHGIERKTREKYEWITTGKAFMFKIF